jgi:2-dehydro-3-deoxy-D-arabinonate dehydratase
MAAAATMVITTIIIRYAEYLKLYLTSGGYYIQEQSRFFQGREAWDVLLNRDDLFDYLSNALDPLASTDGPAENDLLAPVASGQEVWAAGVTYYRSRDARMEESKSAGGGDFYDRVYSAERPELFFKATARRVVPPNGKVAIRDDASWSVPEPELTLVITRSGKIVGYTIGNDMSSRDIEGENPLYLPQAKVYDRSCSIGPCILVTPQPLPPSTEIRLEILRGGKAHFSGSTALSELKRDPAQLVEYLYRNNSFPNGCLLLTGTGIVPPDSFTLQHGDEIRITVPPIGTLINTVA